MIAHFLDKIGDWNPQLLRELKGRLKTFPALIAVAISLLVQFVVFLYQLRELPGEKYLIYEQYCTLGLTYDKLRLKIEGELAAQYQQLQELFRRYSSPEEFDKIKLQEIKTQIVAVQDKQRQIYENLYKQYCPLDKIDMQMWWRDHWGYLFTTLSVIFIFTLLVAGTYLLINNLATEERRGTLNFIRLSPQAETSILTGKMLGVPILIYLVVLIAMPLHFYAGIGANIATSHILGFWAVLIANCIFFYSAALLFGSSSRGFSGFQPWLGSGAVLLFLVMTLALTSSSSYSVETAWFRMFSPFDVTNYLFPKSFNPYNGQPLERLQFFGWEVGKSVVGIVSLHIANYGLFTYWAWQALRRCFRNPNSTIISKQQSYFLIASLQIFNLGFYAGNFQSIQLLQSYDIQNNVKLYYTFQLLTFLVLIALLTPHRQTIQDWARYRHQNRKKSLWNDLIRGERSPAILAIAINLVIAVTPLIVLMLLWQPEKLYLTSKIQGLLAVGLFMGWIMICAVVAQLMLLIKTPKRTFWAIGSVTAIIFLPPTILGLLNVTPYQNSTLWLFTSYSWIGVSQAAITTIFMPIMAQLTILGILIFQVIRQVKLAGESATQALLAGRN